MTFSERKDYGDGEQISGCQGVGEGKCVSIQKQLGEFGGDGTVLCLGCGIYTCARTHGTVHRHKKSDLP